MRPRMVVLVGMVAAMGCAPAPRVSIKRTLSLREEAHRLGLQYPLRFVFLQAYKHENRLELWASNDGGQMTRVRKYPIAAASGGPGPKRREGDRQVPEGVYRIDRYSPRSQFHLSLGLDYPNASDRRRSDSRRPGSDIFIHGNRVSIGCLAMTDALIDEIYPACWSAKNRRSIAVHVFPCRMDSPAMAELLRENPQHAALWRELRPVYDAFEATKKVPKVRVTKSGAYRVEELRL